MKLNIKSRQFLSWAILLFYLAPLLFFSVYSIGLMSRTKSWSILSIGLLMVACGSLALILLLRYWEKGLKSSRRIREDFEEAASGKVTGLESSFSLAHTVNGQEEELKSLREALKGRQENGDQLLQDLEKKNQELHNHEEENRSLQVQVMRITQDFADYKLFCEENLKQKNLQLTACQQTVDHQQGEIEKGLEQISELQAKVRDLSYEIKTLLYLNEDEVKKPQLAISGQLSDGFKLKESIAPYAVTVPPKKAEEEMAYAVTGTSVKTPAEALLLLRRCLNIAQKLTGANYYGNESSRYREPSSQHYTIDLRRLFDSLRSETGAMITVYSQKEQRFIFVNNACKALLGWGADKFEHDFQDLIQEGEADWTKALASLTTYPDSQARLVLKAKSGEDLLLHCHLGMIPTGLFRHFIIGIFYPA